MNKDFDSTLRVINKQNNGKLLYDIETVTILHLKSNFYIKKAL